MSRPQSNGNDEHPHPTKHRHSRFILSPAQMVALNATARSLPKERRDPFLLHVLAALRCQPHSVSDEQVSQAIASALKEHAA
jgi:hypothetical protein